MKMLYSSLLRLPFKQKVLIPAPIMRLFRLKSRFSKHRAAPRLVLWQAKQCFIRENCGGAVALSGGGTTSSCSHWWSFFPEAKGSEELQNSAGLFIRWCSPIIYYSTTTPAELGSVRVMRKFAKTTFWHLLDSFHSAAATTLFLD